MQSTTSGERGMAGAMQPIIFVSDCYSSFQEYTCSYMYKCSYMYTCSYYSMLPVLWKAAPNT